MKRTVHLKIDVSKVPANISDAKVAQLVNQMLEIGYNDAAETVDDPDLNCAEAGMVCSMKFGQAKVLK